MEARELLQVLAHVVLLELLEQRPDCLIVDRLLGELHALYSDLVVQSAKLWRFGDIEEVDAFLQAVSGVVSSACLGERPRQKSPGEQLQADLYSTYSS